MHQGGEDIGTGGDVLTRLDRNAGVGRQVELDQGTEVDHTAALALTEAVAIADEAVGGGVESATVHDHDDVVILVGTQPDAVRPALVIEIGFSGLR